MSSSSNEPGAGRPGDQDGQDEATEGVGAEIGMTDGDGSTFEPEEDPEGHAD